MKTSNINYFFSVSSEYRFDVEETISKLLLLENLLKLGKLKEREKTTAYDDVRFLFDFYKKIVPNGFDFYSKSSEESERIYADFKLKLLQEQDSASDDLEEELITIFNKNRKFNFFLFNEFTVVKTLVHWIKGKNTKGTAYCPFNNIINAEAELSKDEISVDAPSFGDNCEFLIKALIYMLIGNVKNVRNFFTSFEEQIKSHNSTKEGAEYGFGFSCLPMGFKVGPTKRFVDAMFVEDMLNRVNGRFAVIVPMRLSIGGLRQELELREKISDSGRLKAVISLPAGFLVGTAIYTQALVFDADNSQHESVSFLDLRDREYIEAGKSGRKLVNLNLKARAEIENVLADKESTSSIKVSLSEIKNNENSLDIGRYIAARESAKSLDGIETVNLDDVVEIYRAQASVKDSDGDKYFEISASDINPLGIIETPKKEIVLKKDNRALKSLVHKGDIVLAIKGAAGKVGLVETEHDNWLAGQSFVILRLKDKAWTPEFLFWQLNSKRIKKQLGLLSTGGFIQLLKISDVKGLKLIPPTKEILQKVHDANLRRSEILQKIKDLQAELASLDEII